VLLDALQRIGQDLTVVAVVGVGLLALHKPIRWLGGVDTRESVAIMTPGATGAISLLEDSKRVGTGRSELGCSSKASKAGANDDDLGLSGQGGGKVERGVECFLRRITRCRSFLHGWPGWRCNSRTPQEGSPMIDEWHSAHIQLGANASMAENHMGDGARVAKRAHSAGFGLHTQVERQCWQRHRHRTHRTNNVWVKHPQLRIWCCHATAHPKCKLQQARHARCRLGVPNVGLHTAHHRWPSWFTVDIFMHSPHEGARLNGVTQCSASSVSFVQCEAL